MRSSDVAMKAAISIVVTCSMPELFYIATIGLIDQPRMEKIAQKVIGIASSSRARAIRSLQKKLLNLWFTIHLLSGHMQLVVLFFFVSA